MTYSIVFPCLGESLDFADFSGFFYTSIVFRSVKGKPSPFSVAVDREVALIESGSWAPMAAKVMKELLAPLQEPDRARECRAHPRLDDR